MKISEETVCNFPYSIKHARLLFCGVILLTTTLLYLFPKPLSLAREILSKKGRMVDRQIMEFDFADFNNTSPIILDWTGFFGQSYFEEKWRSESVRCPELQCQVTSDRSYERKASAIIFHIRDFLTNWDYPQFRKTGQIYIFFLMESPYHVFRDLKILSEFFNWTMTYRRDSDLDAFYDEVWRPDLNLSGKELKNLVNNKDNKTFIAWFVSNCQTLSGRERLVEKIKKRVPVDIYGNCGKLHCPIEKNIECNEILRKKYKFYLSFENSVCKDYVTEKFFRATQLYTVPVVLRSKDYQGWTPPNSYIAVDNFTNVDEFANYLINLNADDEAYMAYLKWTLTWPIRPKESTQQNSTLCQLCKKLKERRFTEEHKVYTNIHKWFIEDAKCQSPYPKKEFFSNKAQ